MPLVRCVLWRGLESSLRIREHFSVADPERLDPALLTEGERDERAELDQLGSREVLVEACPELIVGNFRVPDDGAGIGQCQLLTLVVAV